MLFRNGISFMPGRFTPNPRKSVEWNRGAYIAEAAGHCQSCHTPKDILGDDKASAPYTGATLDGWFAPDLMSNQHKGIGGWSSDALIRHLKSGANTWTLASGPMADVAGAAVFQSSIRTSRLMESRSPRTES